MFFVFGILDFWLTSFLHYKNPFRYSVAGIGETLRAVKGAFMPSQWDKVILKTMEQLRAKNLSVTFNRPKNDDSHVKAKAPTPCSYWAFARTADKLWVELELKPQTRNGLKVPQDETYKRIVANKAEIEKSLGAPIDSTPGGNDRRIKSFISEVSGNPSGQAQACSERMAGFICILTRYLHA